MTTPAIVLIVVFLLGVIFGAANKVRAQYNLTWQEALTLVVRYLFNL